MSSSAAAVASWVAALRWEDLPAPVRDRARATLANDLGALLGGLPTPASRIAAAYAAAEGAGDGLVVGAEGRFPVAAAAFANGVAASTLDYDGGHYLGGGIHPGPAAVGALVTLLESPHVEGRDVLTALVAGYEVAIRLGYLLWPDDRTGQAHTSGTATAVGAAAASSRLLGLSSEATRRALEIAWAHAPMSALQFPMVKESLGWAAATGVSAARLADLGFKRQPSDGPAFAAAVHPPTPFDTGRTDEFVGELGSGWRLLDVYFKRYAACRYTHAAADAALALRERHGLSPADIATIVIRTHANATFLDDPSPDTDDGAQYSFPYVVSAVLHDGEFGAEQLDVSRLDDPDRRALAKRVAVDHDPSLDDAFPHSYPASVEITTKSGETVTETRRGASGDVTDPLSDRALSAKFARLARRVLGEQDADALAELLSQLDERPGSALAAALAQARLDS